MIESEPALTVRIRATAFSTEPEQRWGMRVLRCERVPGTRLSQDSTALNIALERTAGSHSLAAAAHRGC
jgi:hypothetical protein